MDFLEEILGGFGRKRGQHRSGKGLRSGHDEHDDEDYYRDDRLVKCVKCTEMLPESFKFCPECGAPVTTGAFCVKCGAQMGMDASFCPKCGARKT